VVDSPYCIDIKDLRFRYDARAQFSIESLKIKTGSHCFLEGPSGSGKSTVLGLLSGILRPDTGQISVLGQNLTQLSAPQLDRFRAAKIGYIFQRFNLIPHLTVGENIALANFFGRSKKTDREDKQKILQALGVEQFLDQKAGAISVGQAQRVAAARALIKKPAVLLADEPTSSLDQPRQKAFMDILLDLSKQTGTTVVFVSHNPSLGSYFDQRLKVSDFLEVSTR